MPARRRKKKKSDGTSHQPTGETFVDHVIENQEIRVGSIVRVTRKTSPSYGKTGQVSLVSDYDRALGGPSATVKMGMEHALGLIPVRFALSDLTVIDQSNEQPG